LNLPVTDVSKSTSTKDLPKEERNSRARHLIVQMWPAYRRSDWEMVRAIHNDVSQLKPSRALLIEAGHMAVAALVALDDRKAARKLVADMRQQTYKKALHYEYLARACLELKQYEHGADALHKAQALL
jgi:hypothetical protein